MAITATTLNGAVASTDTSIRLTSGTGAAVGSFVRIDSEFVRILDITNTPTVAVQRGQVGTLGAAHTTLAPAVIGLPSDFENVPEPRSYSYGADGAITIAPGFHLLKKATAGAYTLANPSQADNGIQLVFTSGTAAAHVITGVTIWDGTATANTTLTFTAIAGASCTLVANNGAWNTLSLEAVTPAP